MRKLLGVGSLMIAAGVAGCDGGGSSVLGGIPSVVYIQRAPLETGDVLQYTSSGGEGNLFSLTPPTASGVKKNLTNWSGGDVASFDLSFDARELVFSGKAPGDSRFHIFRINVDGSNPCDADLGKVSDGPCQITDGGNDESYPIYLPGGRIFYVTNKNVEGPAVPQFRDEYERGTTAQVATMMKDGSDQILGPRNVSHRVSPTLLQDGRVLFTNWGHLGGDNTAPLLTMNQNMTNVREAFGREGKGLTNSYIRAKEVSPGKLVAIGTSRDRTFQSGKILMIDLGSADPTQQSEANSRATDLTPDVPGDREPSFKNIGRYYDVRPVGDSVKEQYLVTWSDGAVESEVLAMAKAKPDFGIYVYDAKAKTRFPLVNELGTWEVSPMAVIKRDEPPMLASQNVAQGTQSTLLAAVNVYDSSLLTIPAGSVKKVRITEGFSSEEGFGNDFGLTEFDGMSRLGEADVGADGSFKALVPANTPVRMELLDKYGLAIKTSNGMAQEPLWTQGGPGEARVCGGCHEDRTKPIQVAPGSSALQALGAAALDYPGVLRSERKSEVYSAAEVRGVPWDKALQPIFDAKCVACHDGSAGAANKSYSITDMGDMSTFNWTFNLKGDPVTLSFGDMMYTYSASHVSLLGPEMATREAQVAVTGDLKIYVSPGSARDSIVIQMLNPPARYPSVDFNDRAFPDKPVHPAEVGVYNGIDGAAPQYQLTADEYYLLSLMADNGGQYHSRENAPGTNY